MWHRIEISNRRDHHDRADSDARCSGYTIDFCRRARPGNSLFLHRAGNLGMSDNTGQLGGHGNQKGFITFIKATSIRLLDDQHPQYIALVDDRHTEECVVQLFTNTGKELEAGVVFGILQVDRLFTFGHQAHQPFTGGQAGHTDQVLVETFGGTKHVTTRGQVTHIDTAHLGAHGIAHTPHNDFEGIVQALCGIDLLDNMAQRLKHTGL